MSHYCEATSFELADQVKLLAEEIHDASRVLPVAMLWTLILNGVTGLIMTITFAFCLGDITAALTPKYNFTYIDVFYNSTQSRAGATIMASLITLMTLCSTISNVATASRQMFAFARDSGLPFATFLSKVRTGKSPEHLGVELFIRITHG